MVSFTSWFLLPSNSLVSLLEKWTSVTVQTIESVLGRSRQTYSRSKQWKGNVTLAQIKTR